MTLADDDTQTKLQWMRHHFERTKHWIAEALREQPYASHTLEHVWEAIESGNCVIWPTAHSVTVVEIVDHPTGLRTLHHWLAGGDLDELRRTERHVEEYGRENGFAAITILGRNGWQRALPGYRKGVTLFVKDLA